MNRKQLVLIVLMALAALVIPSVTAGAFLMGIAIGAFFAVQLSE
jgi:hypothetical protein